MNYNEIKMNVPIDFDIVFDEKTQEWVTRPIKGFSEKHLNEVSFVPMKESHSANTYNSKNKNSNLHSAKREKNDEFYTRLLTLAEVSFSIILLRCFKI